MDALDVVFTQPDLHDQDEEQISHLDDDARIMFQGCQDHELA